MPKLVPQDCPEHASPTDLETRALTAVMGTRGLGSFFMSALRKANQLFGAALLLQLADLRRASDPLAKSFAQGKELELKLAFAHQTIDVLLDRLNRVPPSHRPHYRPADRGRILHHKDALHLSCQEIARLYALARSTVHRWVVDTLSPKKPDRPLVSPAPPDRSFCQLVKRQVRNLAMAGFGGSLRIAQTLALEGLRISRSTVRRWTKEPDHPGSAPQQEPRNPAAGAGKPERPKAVFAKRPNHVLMVDVTLIKSLAGFLFFRLALVLDSCGAPRYVESYAPSPL